jgi:hypothetical protein
MTSIIPKIPLFTKRLCSLSLAYFGICRFVTLLIGDDSVLMFKAYYYFQISYSPVYEIILLSQVKFRCQSIPVLYILKLYFQQTLDLLANALYISDYLQVTLYVSGARYLLRKHSSCNIFHFFSHSRVQISQLSPLKYRQYMKKTVFYIAKPFRFERPYFSKEYIISI